MTEGKIESKASNESTHEVRAEEPSTAVHRLGDKSVGNHLVPGFKVAGRYEILSELGSGAQARVFRARDLELDEELALKVLGVLASDAGEAEQQFKQEIRLARRIVHPNVCHTYDFGRDGDLLFVTMEVIPGTTLTERMKDGLELDLDERLSLFRDTLVGVRAAHSLGIIHRDIKPQNVMVTDDGRAVVMDFGLAGEAEKMARASGGSVLGTPAYIAPERLRGIAADARSDIYALGVLLFELTTGRKPFTGSVSDVIYKHLHEPVPRPGDLDDSIPDSMSTAVLKMMAKDPEERFSSVDQILEVLAEIRSTPEGRTVVLAVADEDLRALIEHHLTAFGLSVEPAGGGEEAIETLLREKPDSIVLEVEMPGIDGFRITEMIRRYSHLEEVPVYLLSNVRDASYLAYARQLGVAELVKKPMAVRAFAQSLKDSLEAG